MGMQSLDELTTKTAEKLNALYNSIAGLAEAGVSSDFENSLSLGSDDKPFFKERTAAEIKTAYESNSDTNSFSDAYKGILDNLDTDLTNKLDRGGYTGTAQDLKDDIDGFVSDVSSDADNSLTLGSDDKPFFKQRTNAEIKTAYESNANTNVFTDAEKTSLSTALQPNDLDDYLTESESDLKYTPLTRTLTAGNGIQTIGDLSQNRAINLDFDYLDGRYASGFKQREAVRVTTMSNISLSGLQTIDGVTLVVGDRVLVKNQTNAALNGVYIAASGTWTRASDFDEPSLDEVAQGASVFVEEGTMNAATGWSLSTPAPITVGTTELIFIQYAGSTSYQGGDKITIAGTQINHDTGTWTAKTALSGATVISNLSVDTYGHLVNWSTRNLTAGDVGALTESIGDNRYILSSGNSIKTSGNTTFNDGIPIRLGTDVDAIFQYESGFGVRLRLDTSNFFITDGASDRFTFERTTGNFNATGNITGSNLSGNNTGDQTLSGLGGVPTSRTISTGTGLTGGGDLSSNRTFDLDPSYTGFDDRYYTKTQADGKYLLNTTDSFNGSLSLTGGSSSTLEVRDGGWLNLYNSTNDQRYSINAHPSISLDIYDRTNSRNADIRVRNVFFNTERPWSLKQTGSGATARLSFIESTGTKSLTVGNDSNDSVITFNSGSGDILTEGTVTAASFSGNGSGLTNVNADRVDGKHIWTGSQSSYDAIGTKDANTLYFIT